MSIEFHKLDKGTAIDICIVDQFGTVELSPLDGVVYKFYTSNRLRFARVGWVFDWQNGITRYVAQYSEFTPNTRWALEVELTMERYQQPLWIGHTAQIQFDVGDILVAA